MKMVVSLRGATCRQVPLTSGGIGLVVYWDRGPTW
jgi:hypothetical protein